MIEETIGKLEERLKNSGTLTEETRQELLNLLQTLKTEASNLSRTHAEDAEKIVDFTQASTQEATRTGVSQERLNANLRDLSASVDGFEQSHPQLVQIVNRISEILANLGI